jgi:hypothetical protein
MSTTYRPKSMRGRLRGMIARQAVVGDMGKVDANFSRFQTDPCKDLPGQVFCLKWRGHHQGVQKAIVTVL